MHQLRFCSNPFVVVVVAVVVVVVTLPHFLEVWSIHGGEDQGGLWSPMSVKTVFWAKRLWEKWALHNWKSSLAKKQIIKARSFSTFCCMGFQFWIGKFLIKTQALQCVFTLVIEFNLGLAQLALKMHAENACGNGVSQRAFIYVPLCSRSCLKFKTEARSQVKVVL
jgi:hypothetical protein